jgi:uncharacterized protein (DUF302 family)
MYKVHRPLLAGLLLATACAAPLRAQSVDTNGIVRVRSAYPMDETVARLRNDIAAKGILFFQAIDQSQLAAKAGIVLRPSTLLEFGNPPLGAQFLTANPDAGLDWPVRLLVSQDEAGVVWASWTDFSWIAKRHGITNRQEQFATATGVVESITSTLKAR